MRCFSWTVEWRCTDDLGAGVGAPGLCPNLLAAGGGESEVVVRKPCFDKLEGWCLRGALSLAGRKIA